MMPVERITLFGRFVFRYAYSTDISILCFEISSLAEYALSCLYKICTEVSRVRHFRATDCFKTSNISKVVATTKTID